MAKKALLNGSSKRVGIWIRVSTEDQAQGESPQHHEQRARWYAESKGWHVIELYNLAGVSGKSVMDHPECRRMMKDIESGHISGLIFSKLARLGRNLRELLEFSEYFQKHDAALISLAESIDTSTAVARLFYAVIAALAHWEREETSERVRASIPVRARLGKRLGGSSPYGYHWVNNQLVPHPEHAPVRKLIHELYLKHKRQKTVIKLLTQMGYRNRHGKPFTESAMRFMLEDPTPKGLHRANYQTLAPGTNSYVRKPEEEWIYHEVPPIMEAAVWDASYELFRAQFQHHKKPARRAVQLFGGLTWCECGEKMYVKSNTPKYVCPKCKNKIPIADLEGVFFEELKRYMLSRDSIEAHLHEADESIAKRRELLDHLEREKAKVRVKMDKLLELYMENQLTKAGFGEQYKPLEERLAQLNEEWPRLQAELDCLKVNRVSTDEVLEQAQSLADYWPKLDAESRREIVEALVKKVILGRGEIQFDLYFLPELLGHPKPEESDPPPDDPPPSKQPQLPTSTKSNASAFNKKLAKRASNLSVAGAKRTLTTLAEA